MEANTKNDFAKLMEDRDAVTDDSKSWAKANDALDSAIQKNQKDWETFRRKKNEEALNKLIPDGKTSEAEKKSSVDTRGNNQSNSTRSKSPVISNARTAQTNPQQTSNMGMASSTSQMKSQFQQGRAQTLRNATGPNLQQNPFTRPQGRPNEKQKNKNQQNDQEQEDGNEEEEDENEEDENGVPALSPMQQLQQAQERMKQIAGSQASTFKKGLAMARQFNSLQAATAEEAKPSQDIAKAAVKKMIPKAAMMIANFIASALELGTGGVAFLLTFIVRFITLGWYNTEMIYGGFIMKGKHLLIGPLTWDPIPIPFIKKTSGENSLSFMAIVIMMDLIVIITALMPFVFLGTLIAMFKS